MLRSAYRAILAALAVLCFRTIAAYGTETTYNLAATVDPVKSQLTAGNEQNILMIGDGLTFRTDSYLFTLNLLCRMPTAMPGLATKALAT